jgi:hypothetical protein
MVSYVPEVKIRRRQKDEGKHSPPVAAEPFAFTLRDRADGETFKFYLSRRDLAILVRDGQRLLKEKAR